MGYAIREYIIAEVILFHRPGKSPVFKPTKALKELTQMTTPASFLAEAKRQMLLQKMNEYSGLDARRYEALCTTLVDNLVHYCQHLPETANSYYSQAGGLVDHALNRTEAALGLFKEFLVYEQPEVLSEEQKLWQYVLYSAALVQGIGKLFIDYRINLFDLNGQLLKPWNPLLESLSDTGSYYDYEFQKEADIDFRRRLNLLLAKALMPGSGFSWIASDSKALAVWLALLNEDQRSAGTLGALLIRADAIALQRYFSEFLLRNVAGRGGPFGRAGTFSGGTPESVAEKEQVLAIEFIQWLTQSLENGLVMINKAPLWMVPGGLLMCQEMYQLFVREHPEYKNWQAVQKAFLSLGLHQRGMDGLATARFEQAHTQQMHSGTVFSGYAVALPAQVSVHHLNTGMIESMSAVDFIHRSQENHNFTQQPAHGALAGVQKLSALGQWVPADIETPVGRPGVGRGV